MLLNIFNDTLVNGLIGIVIDMFEDSVNVKFEIGSKTVIDRSCKTCTSVLMNLLEKLHWQSKSSFL